MEKQEDIERFFHSALLQFLKERGRGGQAFLARQTGLTPPYIHDIVTGKKYGSEKAKRAIANALGQTYEGMINMGRGKGPPPFRPQPASQIPAKTRRLLELARQVLESKTPYSQALEKSIRFLFWAKKQEG